MSAFDELASNLGDLAGLPSRVSKEVADGINELMQDQFNSETDPYGNPWPALLPQTVKRKKGDSRILRLTDTLLNNTVASASSGSGVDITSESYGEYHQGGTKNMVAREILPGGKELPEEWLDLIESVLNEKTGGNWTRK